MMTEAGWAIIVSQAQREELAAAAVEALGFRVYLPMIESAWPGFESMKPVAASAPGSRTWQPSSAGHYSAGIVFSSRGRICTR